ncbi:MAG: hypothetical protein WC299_16035 [Kiritimatiellia bacterium]
MSWKRIFIIIGAVVYTATLQWAYPFVLVPSFGYAGMTYADLTATTVAIQYVLACLPSLWLPAEINKPSQFQWWVLYVTVIVPSCILPYHVTGLAPENIHLFLIFIIACFAIMCTVSFLRPISLPHFIIQSWAYTVLLGAITVLTYAWLAFYRGLPAMLLPLEQVYELRTELRGSNLPAFLSYLIWWQGMVVNPLISAIGFIRRRWLVVGAGCLLQVMLYSMTSLRTFLCAMVFQAAFGIFLLLFRRLRGPLFLYALIASVFVAVGWNLYDRQAISPLLLLDRWIFNAGQLSGYYLEFFSYHPPAYMQHSSLPFLRWLFPGPYDLPIGQVIGRAYFIEQSDGVFTNATAHLWADGFAAFGYGGVVASSFFAALALWLADSLCLKIPPRLVLTAYCMVSMSLINQGVQTMMLTGGMLPFLLLLIFVPNYRLVSRDRA